MTIHGFWIDSNDGVSPAYNADKLRRLFAHLFAGTTDDGRARTGIISGFNVSLQDSTANISGGLAMVTKGGASYLALSDGDEAIDLPSPHATYGRYHTLVMDGEDTGDSHAVGSFAFIAGNASASPQPPAITSGVILGDLFVPSAGAPAFNTSRRPTVALKGVPQPIDFNLGTGYTGYVRGTQVDENTTIIDVNVTRGSGAGATIAILDTKYYASATLSGVQNHDSGIVVCMNSSSLSWAKGYIPTMSTRYIGTIVAHKA